MVPWRAARESALLRKPWPAQASRRPGCQTTSPAPGTWFGHQFEMRVRWQPLPGNLLIEGGYAHLFAGEFIDNAPNSPMQGDTGYVYVQAVVRL